MHARPSSAVGQKPWLDARGIAAFSAQLGTLASLLLGLAMLNTPILAAEPERPAVTVLASVPADVRGGDSLRIPVDDDLQSFVVRTGDVRLVTDLLSIDGSSLDASSTARDSLPNLTSRTLAFELFPDTYVEILVSSQSRPTSSVLSISGGLRDGDLSTFSMTMTPDSYLLTYQDRHTQLLYRVVGDTSTGIGRVTEYDRRHQPMIIHSSPLIPPAE
ncbi:hypothetical protein CKO23_14850 [Thiocystis violacea]|nr:hypothetical protein [Thiocystis violacea]